LDVLYAGLGKSNLRFLVKESEIYFSAEFFFTFWSSKVKTLDPDPDSLEILDPDSINESGATTLVRDLISDWIRFN
jgi:hypothetical protein